MFSSAGPAQWRLNGIDAMPNAAQMVRSVPVPPTAYIGTLIILLALLLAVYLLVSHPWAFSFVALASFGYKYIKSQNEENI